MKIGLLLMTAGALVAAGLAPHPARAADAPPAAASAPPAGPPVTVAKALKRSVVEWDEYTGQFAPVEFVEIRARVSGYLNEILFQDGQIVKKGDPLFVIDPRPYEIALASARAQVTQAQARLELAQRQVNRATELRQRDFVAASTYDERAQEQRQATGAVEAARAAVRSAELDLEFTRLLAPVGGRISRKEVSIGNLVSGGSSGASTLLTTIVSLDPIQFQFDMSEQDFLSYQRSVAKGELSATRSGNVPVELHLTDEQGWPRKGRIDFVDNRVDRSSGTIRVRAIFPNPDLFLTPGQFGRVRIPGSDSYEAILIPDEALVTDQSRKIVMTVAPDGTVVPKPVRPGPSIDGLRVIRTGLTDQDRVIINGLVRARPGAKVTPIDGKIEATPAG